MTAAAQTKLATTKPNLRSFDFKRDLHAVADLVELCFADRLDEDGRKYVQQMRSTASRTSLLNWANSTNDRTSMLLGGFIWLDGEKLVGNLSLLPVTASGQRAYLIANVAVHPEYRRRGIGRELTEAAFEYIQMRNVKWSWLQVDDDNLAALELYQGAGFNEVVRRTTWHSNPNKSGMVEKPSQKLKITSRKAKDWPLQKDWLDNLYPPEVRWHLPLRRHLLKPGLSGSFNRLMNEQWVRQWSVRRDGKLLGVLTRQSSRSQADKLWLSTTPEYEEEVILSLMPIAQRTRPAHRTLALDYPSGRAAKSLEKAGFYNHQTLVWMKREM